MISVILHAKVLKMAILLLLKKLFIDFKERKGEGREGNISTCHSTYSCIH